MAATAHIAAKLKTRFHRAPLPQGRHVTGIVVLGGGLDRAKEALVLARRHPRAIVIVSGAAPVEEAILSGAPELADRLRIDRLANTTFENAVNSAALAKPKPGEHWLIVTSALHMPRSIGAFRAVGFAVHAWPVHDTDPDPRYAAECVRHELFGLFYYRLLGRTHELLPGMAS